jgi:hypothetical protein
MLASRWFALNRFPLFTLTAGLGLTVGFLVPVAYELMEEPWNRTRLVSLERAAMVTAALTCMLCALAAWLGKSSEPSETVGPRKFQFRIWQLFAVMSVAAILLAAQKWLDLSWASALVAAVALGVLGWAGRSSRMRGRDRVRLQWWRASSARRCGWSRTTSRSVGPPAW